MLLSAELATYTVEQEGARNGGQARVWRADDPSGRPVAVKIARPEAATALRAERAAFEAIRRADPRANEWLVEMLDAGEYTGCPFLVLRWYEHNLRSWLDGRRQRVESVLLALEGAASAVARLHQSSDDPARLRIHRDVKPTNFLVDDGPDGLRVVLADLGILKEGTYGETAAHTLAYTAHYAPIEQVLPLDRPLSPAVDVHALAVTIFVALTGNPPRSVMAAPLAVTDTGARLLTLESRTNTRSPDEQAEYRRLRREAIDRLVDFSELEPLTAADENTLRNALYDELAPRHPRAQDLAEAVAGTLLPALGEALRPDPDTRLPFAGRLVAALRSARVRLEAELGVPAPRTPAPPPPEDRTPGPRARRQRIEEPPPAPPRSETWTGDESEALPVAPPPAARSPVKPPLVSPRRPRGSGWFREAAYAVVGFVGVGGIFGAGAVLAAGLGYAAWQAQARREAAAAPSAPVLVAPADPPPAPVVIVEAPVSSAPRQKSSTSTAQPMPEADVVPETVAPEPEPEPATDPPEAVVAPTWTLRVSLENEVEPAIVVGNYEASGRAKKVFHLPAGDHRVEARWRDGTTASARVAIAPQGTGAMLTASGAINTSRASLPGEGEATLTIGRGGDLALVAR